MADGDGLLKPGEVIKPPALTDEALIELVDRLFGVKATKLKSLDSYDDRNYRLTVASVYENDHINLSPTELSNGLTLKISNSLDTRTGSLLESLTDVMEYVANQGISVPFPLKTKDGLLVKRIPLASINDNYRKQSENQDQTLYGVRLFTFIQGAIFKTVPYTPGLLFHAGQITAKLTIALKGYRNEHLERRTFLWSLLNAPKVREFMHAINDEHRRHLIAQTMNDFEEQILNNQPLRDRLDTCIIHSDLNEQNLLVQKADDVDDWRISGILDFGDVHAAPRIFDLAILCAYVLLDCETMDPLDAPGHVISGYRSKLAIEPYELELLPLCIEARLGQSLTMGAYSYSQDPTNEYILSSAKNGWKLLDRLRSLDPKTIVSNWEAIFNQKASP